MKSIGWLCLVSSLVLTACAGGPPKLPYPAFVQVDELEDVFMASLPGIRAKQLAGDPQTRRSSKRIDLPSEWNGTSGGMPGRSLEIFVLRGSLTIADIELGRGGYAFLPAGSLGFNMRTDAGAQILYFLNDVDRNRSYVPRSSSMRACFSGRRPTTRASGSRSFAGIRVMAQQPGCCASRRARRFRGKCLLPCAKVT